MTKLNQIIAIEKGIKARNYSEFSELHKLTQKNELFNGFSNTYEPINAEGQPLPPEKKRVQYNAKEVLKTAERLQSEMMKITARKDWTNAKATASVIVDGKKIIEDAPVTYLLFLEKQLHDLRTFLDTLPVLDENENWKLDANSGLYKTEIIQKHRTNKVIKPLVLYPATEQHPAQTQVIQEDALVGFWNQEKHSGAMPKPEKLKLLDRLETLLQAVKQAREAANIVDEIPSPDVGDAVYNFLLEE